MTRHERRALSDYFDLLVRLIAVGDQHRVARLLLEFAGILRDLNEKEIAPMTFEELRQAYEGRK